MTIFSLYQIKNKINQKLYIGVTMKPQQRFCQHKSSIGKKTNHPLYVEMEQYGIDNFLFEIVLQSKSSQFISNMEKQFIKEFSPEYNLQTGGYNPRRGDKIFDSIVESTQIEENKNHDKIANQFYTCLFESVLGKDYFTRLFYQIMIDKYHSSK